MPSTRSSFISGNAKWSEQAAFQVVPSGFKPRPRYQVYDVERNAVSGWTLNSVLTGSSPVDVTNSLLSSNRIGPQFPKLKTAVRIRRGAPSTRGEIGHHTTLRRLSSRLVSGRVDHRALQSWSSGDDTSPTKRTYRGFESLTLHQDFLH
jgi:hypothetical protein